VKLIIGIIVSIIPILNWCAKGFAIESSGLSKTKASVKMPEWKNWWNLFIKGLAADIIFLIYMIPTIIVIGAVISSLIASLGSALLSTGLAPWTMTTQQQNRFVVVLLSAVISEFKTLLPAIVLMFILAILAIYLTPMAVLNYVSKRRFSAAFDLGTVFKKAFTSRYFVSWLLVAVVTLVLVGILSLIPIIGAAIGIFVMRVAAYTIFGQVFRETR